MASPLRSLWHGICFLAQLCGRLLFITFLVLRLLSPVVLETRRAATGYRLRSAVAHDVALKDDANVNQAKEIAT